MAKQWARKSVVVASEASFWGECMPPKACSEKRGAQSCKKLEVMHKKRLDVFAVLAKLVQYPLMATVYAKLPSVRKKKRLFNC